MPRVPKDHRFAVVPDWVCEILSLSTEHKDREIKMPLSGVAHALPSVNRKHKLHI
jgi:Uma2 family endonuclease